MQKSVLILGLGLIGGSIALSIKQEYPQVSIIGYDRDENTLKAAKKLGVIDDKAESIVAAEEADYIIFSTPVIQTLELMNQISTLSLKRDVIITDVGSTKGSIAAEGERLFTGSNGVFVGGHPMAGSHKSGVTAARARLFENAFYILTPTSKESAEAAEKLKVLLKGTNAHFIDLDPQQHDSLTGVISHFPHVIAAGLVRQAEILQESQPLTSRLAAGGFRDITRIASSNPAMWRDILLQNKEELLKLFQQWQGEMDYVRTMIEEEDAAKIYTYFLEAKQFRDGLPVKTKGAIPAFYDLYVDVPDYPGIISEITGYLAEEEISITNIRIIETREEIYGVLRLSFQSEADRMRAQRCIETKAKYDTFFME
ncbi:prephenate dehydrogenase [Bacillus lacus]|uniref:Prephenate dehydrogenase n=1 Tax=Metabacillus lacus TaxID=1983721 RepID=A0A7X2IWN9_9BACI|nr:prephenate dehydrogenase [Metabacillus lacus]MRX70989.1 prephenate dehydrogenase [Metabacillus lacus]